MRKVLFLTSYFLLLLLPASARVSLPALVSDGMVLQRGQALPLWGWADAGENVNISFRGKTYAAQADSTGCWRVTLPAQKPGGPYAITVGDITVSDVMVGDVWLCSGQSNMDVMVERVSPQYPDATFDYANDRIRLLRVRNTTDTHGPAHDVPTDGWHHLCREAAWRYSALAYFLARQMYDRTGVPQGVIVNSWGGTPIEAWIDADRMRQHYPEAYSETMLYQDDRLVHALQEAGNRANTSWRLTLDSLDPGLAGGWARTAYDDAAWPVVNQYGQLLPDRNLSGSLWLRQHVVVDKAHAGKPCTLLLGTMYDSDITYLNGRQVGTTGYEYPPRRYQVPQGLLAEGDNVIAIRFINHAGVPHFYKQKPYRLVFADGDTIGLSPMWRAQVGARIARAPQAGVSLQNMPSTLYNAVLAPLAPYAVAAAVWYQGETNTGRPQLYAEQLRLMLDSWRQKWQRPDMPFVIVQLAGYMQPSDQPQQSGWAELREAQRTVARDDRHAELAVAIDLGETVDIHPLRKREVAERVANAIDRTVFGKKKAPLSPQPLKATATGATVTVDFDQPLVPRELAEYELAGPDGVYHNARATAQGRSVALTADGVSQPVSVRYAWKHNPIKANTYGQNQLPATPFQMQVAR